MDEEKVRMSLAEREYLMVDRKPTYSGFTPRSHECLTSRRRPHTTTDIECKHLLRSSTSECFSLKPTLEHRLWIEAGRLAAPLSAHHIKDYNSSIWRNFSRQFGLNVSVNGRYISEAVAALYPLNIPAPSQIGDNTFDKYIRETSLFQNDRVKSLAIRRAATDVNEFRKLKCRSEARNPPINMRGDILPPENYKKYAHRFVPAPSRPTSPPPAGQKTDIFGRRYTPRSKPLLWKLSYKLNHPKFQKLQEEIRAQRESAENLHQNNASSKHPHTIHHSV